MTKTRLIFLSFIALFFMRCEKKNTHRYQATEICHNLTLSSNSLHVNDKVYLLYDTRLLLREKIDSLSAQHFNSVFCNRYRKEGTLRLIIRENKKTIIDTNIHVEKPKYGYKIDINRTQFRSTLIADSVGQMN